MAHDPLDRFIAEALFNRSFRHLHAAHKQYFDSRLTVAEQRELGKLLGKLA